MERDGISSPRRPAWLKSLRTFPEPALQAPSSKPQSSGSHLARFRDLKFQTLPEPVFHLPAFINDGVRKTHQWILRARSEQRIRKWAPPKWHLKDMKLSSFCSVPHPPSWSWLKSLWTFLEPVLEAQNLSPPDLILRVFLRSSCKPFLHQPFTRLYLSTTVYVRLINGA